MPTSVTHGIRINEVLTGTRPVTTVATAVIGLVATATDADATTFPLDTAVLITDVRTAVGKAGVNGTLSKALAAIADQCSPSVVVVRVAPGATEADTETAIIGTATAAGQLTGMQALLSAPSQLGVMPRILGVPGFDTQNVITHLIPIAKQLRAMIYAKAVGENETDAATYAGNFGDRELDLHWPDFTDWNGSSVARALGLRALIDQTQGWNKTLSNVPVSGVTGLSKAMTFDMLSSDNIAGRLNSANVTAIIRSNGFRFWGNRTTSSDPLFAFESTVRTAQILQDTIAAGITWAVDKPLTPILVKDLIDSINGAFNRLKTQGRIIGAVASFDPAKNTADALAAGQLTIDYKYTPTAPAEALLLNQTITDEFYANLASQVANIS
jgi:phage tail sheath protein FI